MSPPEPRAKAVAVFPYLRARASNPARSEEIEETLELIRAAGMEPLHWEIQRLNRFDPRTLIGSGKAESLAEAGRSLKATVLVVARPLSGGQVRNLEELTGLEVMDRPEVILDIFSRRARSREGKVQVELARLSYLLPRLTGKGKEMSRLGGGVGTRGPGEMKVEVDRRRIRDRISVCRGEIASIQKSRDVQRARRRQGGLPTVALVGYTNSGKTTLLNALTGAESFADPMPFATLDPLTRRARLPDGSGYLATDTVGFIRDLPPDLSSAFRATLEEMVGVDALIHVSDSFSPEVEAKLDLVSNFLGGILREEIPTLLVLNKVDRLEPERRQILAQRYPDAVLISAKTGQGLGDLGKALSALLSAGPWSPAGSRPAEPAP